MSNMPFGPPPGGVAPTMAWDPNAPAGPSPMMAGPAYRGSSAYEFTPTENEIFSDLAGAMSFVGISSIIVGALISLGCLIALVAIGANSSDRNSVGAVPGLMVAMFYGLEALLAIVVGVWLTRAAGAMRNIVNTQGNDVPSLMAAMVALRKYFGLLRAVIIISVVLVAGACALGMAASVLWSRSLHF